MPAAFGLYKPVSKLFVNDSAFLPLLERLSTEGQTGKNLAIFCFKSSVLYSSKVDKVQLVVGAAHYSIKCSTKSTPFHSPSFDCPAKSTVVKLGKVYKKVSAEVYLSYLYFLAVNVQGRPDSCWTVKQSTYTQHAFVQLRIRDKNILGGTCKELW